MAKSSQNILVIKLGALGDFIQALGAMAAIRTHHPDARISILTTKPFAGFAKDCGYCDEILLDDRPKLYQIGRVLKLRKTLNEGNYDRVYDLQNNDRTSFYFKLFSAPKPEWVGVAKGASHRNTSPERTAGHAFEGHKQTLALAGINHIKIDPLSWMGADLSNFDLKAPYVLLIPGSAPQHPGKRWPAEHYGATANAISAQGYQCVILGTKAESEVTDQIAALCPEALNLNARTGLYDIATLARGAAGAIGNDTGPIHLIAATGCPCLVLFSKNSNPVRHAPQGDHVSILREDALVNLEPQAVLDQFKTMTSHTSKAQSI